MKLEQIKQKYYINARELMQLIPNLTYDNAIKYVNQAREIMKQRNYCIPIARPKIALTKIIIEMFGI